MDVQIARIGTVASPGCRRVLVDRLWPRGLAKDRAPFDEWIKDVAPSTELRRWYGHRLDRRNEFAARYRGELARAQREGGPALSRLLALVRAGPVLLLTATHSVEASHLPVLAQFLCDSPVNEMG